VESFPADAINNRWEFGCLGFRPAAVNMAEDEAAAHRLLEVAGASTLRVYGWNPSAISIGLHQSFESIDMARAARQGIDVIRRPTGGRAVLHAQEATYCVVMRVASGSVREVYATIARGIQRALHIIGIDADLEVGIVRPAGPRGIARTLACFSSVVGDEISFKGRKLVGSAQRRYSLPDSTEVVLQHGSILLGPAHLNIVDYLMPMSPAERAFLQSQLRERTTDASTILRRTVELDEMAEALRSGFEQLWHEPLLTHVEPTTGILQS